MTSSELAAGPPARAARRGGILILAGVLLLLAGLSARMLLGARDELRRAGAAAAAGDAEGQARHLRRAMGYYLPGNPWVTRAHDQLLGLCRRLSRQGERRADALRAWRELRSAILLLRGSTRPFAGTLPEAAREIARLAGPVRGSLGPAGDGSAARRRLAARLARPPEPVPGWTLVALLGFVVWVGAAVALLTLGLRRDATLDRRRFWPSLGVVALGWFLFGLGLHLA